MVNQQVFNFGIASHRLSNHKLQTKSVTKRECSLTVPRAGRLTIRAVNPWYAKMPFCTRRNEPKMTASCVTRASRGSAVAMMNRCILFGRATRIAVVTLCVLVIAFSTQARGERPPLDLKIEQVTFGTKHHFFGYIGQCQTIPWNGGNRYIVGMEIENIDRMPEPQDAAAVILVDTERNNEIIRLDKTYAWNPQQGTMFYWNPRALTRSSFLTIGTSRPARFSPSCMTLKKRNVFASSDTMTHRSAIAASPKTAKLFSVSTTVV